MAEKQQPPSSASTPAAGLSRQEDLEAKKPKPAAWRGGLRMIDDDPLWGKPVQEDPPSSASTPAVELELSRQEDLKAKKPKPASWRGGLRMIDDNPPWGKPVQETEEPASSGDERLLGVDDGSGRVMAASPEERGGGSTRHLWEPRQRFQDSPSSKGSSAEEDRWLPRKGARHISGEPQNISSPRRRVRHDSEETEDIPPRRRRRHDSDEPEDETVTFTAEDTSLVMKGAVFRVKKDAYFKFVFGSRSKREGKVWHCVCKATNSPKPKLVFGLPKFDCGCGRRFLQKNDLDFCLADVRVNYELLVSKIFDQKGPHCIANACCQAMLIMHAMDSITKNKEMNEAMMNIKPGDLATAYADEYQLMEPGSENGRPPSSVHKFIKMALMLKNKGLELEDKTFGRIGDISFIAKDNYEAICEELANGVPLLAVITPGVNFEYLKYCEVYRPPLLPDFHECNDLHKKQKHRVHEAHLVVLVGPAFKARGKNPGRAYYFINSHAKWCKRKVMEDYHESVPGIKKPVDYGIGKVEEEGLVYSVIKLWKFGETAVQGSITLEDGLDKYQNKLSNKQKFTGEYMARPSP